MIFSKIIGVGSYLPTKVLTNKDLEKSLDTTDSREQGETCDDPLSAVSGTNDASGEDQWFTYTTTMEGYLVISSQNETDDALWDTNLLVYADCDSGSVTVAANDDCCEYYGPSTVEIPVSEGETYKIFWSDDWDPDQFSWSVTEIPSEELPELNIGDVEVNNVTRTISFSVYNSEMDLTEFELIIDDKIFSFPAIISSNQIKVFPLNNACLIEL